VDFTWNFVFKGFSFTPGADYGLNASQPPAGQASAGATYSDTPAQNASCAGPMKVPSSDGSPNMAYAEFPQDGPTKALDFTVQLVNGLDLTWPAACESVGATFPTADRLLVGARMPVAVAVRNGIHELGGDHTPDQHAQPFSYPVDDLAAPVIKQSMPHQSSSSNDGSEISTSTEDLRLAACCTLGWSASSCRSVRVGSPTPRSATTDTFPGSVKKKLVAARRDHVSTED
jgi:hypothetical protein